MATVDAAESDLKMLAEISKSPSGGSLSAQPVAFDVSGEGVYYWVYDNGTWYARANAEPVRVSEGSWMPGPNGAARLTSWHAVLAIMDEWGSKVGLYLMAGGRSIKFAEYPRAWVLAYGEDTLVVFAGSQVPPYPGSGQVIAYSVTRQ
jgi:hypothetical protein